MIMLSTMAEMQDSKDWFAGARLGSLYIEDFLYDIPASPMAQAEERGTLE